MANKYDTLSVAEFKATLNINSFEVVKNPKNGKLFVSTGNAIYRIQQDIKLSEPVQFIKLQGEEFSSYCLVNKLVSNNTVATF